MGKKYAAYCIDTSKSAKARGDGVKCHFKNTVETANACKGMVVSDAVKYLEDVKDHKRAVPFKRFNRGIGRTAQGKEFGTPYARWPVKSCDAIISLLKNLIANGEAKGLEGGSLVIRHIQVNQAQKIRNRVYRAHGRINPHIYVPSHIEIIGVEPEFTVPASTDVIQRRYDKWVCCAI